MHISNAGPHQPTAASFFNLQHQIKYVCMYVATLLPLLLLLRLLLVIVVNKKDDFKRERLRKDK